jgi:major membrane immunogen (membrane-anchored lipoprotein)
MTILPMMRGGAVVFVLAAASLIQGCGASGTATPTQVSSINTGPYSGTAWYADLNHVMTSDSGGE